MSDYYTWVGLELTTTFSASAVRNVVTTIYLVLNFLIAFVGERLITRHGHRKLLNSKPLPVTDLSPFLPVISTLKQFWAVRRLPGGWFGLLMIASGAFGLSGRFLVNSFIDAELTALSCNFDYGIVTTQRNASSEGYFSPAAAWAPTALVLRAQQAAVENNYAVGPCSDGVYSKVHYNVTTFCPTEADVLGRWNCTSEPASVITPQDRINDTTILNFANSSTFLYQTYQYSEGRIGDDHGYSDLLSWSSNATLSPLTNLSIRLIVASGLSSTQPALTSNFQCALTITKTSWSPTQINAEYVLDHWSDTMLGSLLDTDPDTYQDSIQSVLNAITMVAGTQNTLWDSSVALSTGGTSTYGCNDYRTVAKPQVFAILLALILILLVIVVMCVSEMLWNRKNRFQPVVASLPIELLEWELAMAKKLVNDDRITVRDLAGCEYEWDKETKGIACRNRRGLQNSTGEVVVHEDKISSKTESRCSFVWNAEFKTVDAHLKADSVGHSSSDVSLSKGTTTVTSALLQDQELRNEE